MNKPSLNLVFRRTHLYLGMLLIPWFMVYAISTFIFNHPPLFRDRLLPEGPKWNKIIEKEYSLDLPSAKEDQRAAAQRILDDLGIKGSFGVNRNGAQLNINVINFWHPKRISYLGPKHRLVVEEQQFAWILLFQRLHFRSGYQHTGWLYDLWAVVVDLICLSFLAWAITGIYIWWKSPDSRRWGWIALAGGLVSFVWLLVSL